MVVDTEESVEGREHAPLSPVPISPMSSKTPVAPTVLPPVVPISAPSAAAPPPASVSAPPVSIPVPTASASPPSETNKGQPFPVSLFDSSPLPDPVAVCPYLFFFAEEPLPASTAPSPSPVATAATEHASLESEGKSACRRGCVNE